MMKTRWGETGGFDGSCRSTRTLAGLPRCTAPTPSSRSLERAAAHTYWSRLLSHLPTTATSTPAVVAGRSRMPHTLADGRLTPGR
jgi:hypothetical protein